MAKKAARPDTMAPHETPLAELEQRSEQLLLYVSEGFYVSAFGGLGLFRFNLLIFPHFSTETRW